MGQTSIKTIKINSFDLLVQKPTTDEHTWYSIFFCSRLLLVLVLVLVLVLMLVLVLVLVLSVPHTEGTSDRTR